MTKFTRVGGAISAAVLLAGCSAGMAVPETTSVASSAVPTAAISPKSSMSSKAASPRKTTTSAKSTSAASSAAPSSAGKAYLKDGVVYGTGYSYKLPANYTFDVGDEGDDTTIKYSDGGIVFYTIVETAGALDGSCRVRDEYIEDAKAKSGIVEVNTEPDKTIGGVKACGLSLKRDGSKLIAYFAVKNSVIYNLVGVSDIEPAVQMDIDLDSISKSWEWK